MASQLTGKLTRIRVQSCGNGDECPALDRRENGGIEVTGYPVNRPGIPAGEAVVLVPDTLIPEVASLDVSSLGAYIAERHRTDLLRVQTLAYYNVASDGDDLDRYLAGAGEPTAPGKQQWLSKLGEDAAAGKHRRNVHIVNAPLSDYLRYQFEWCYTFNVAAGQDVRILDVTEGPAAAHLLRIGDFNVVERQHVVRSRYDTNGTYLGAVQVSADAAESYAALAELAWQLATPFTTWWASHPQYHRSTRAA
jgi:hypothetical protein